MAAINADDKQINYLLYNKFIDKNVRNYTDIRNTVVYKNRYNMEV